MENDEYLENEEKKRAKFEDIASLRSDTNAEIYRQLCLHFHKTEPEELKNRLFNIFLSHIDLSISFDDLFMHKVFTIEEKREMWIRLYGPITVESVCNAVKNLFIKKPYLLQEDIFTNKLPSDVVAMILNHAYDIGEDPKSILTISKKTLESAKRSGELINKIRVGTIFTTPLGRAKLMAGLLLYYAVRPFARNVPAMIMLYENNFGASDRVVGDSFIMVSNHNVTKIVDQFGEIHLRIKYDAKIKNDFPDFTDEVLFPPSILANFRKLKMKSTEYGIRPVVSVIKAQEAYEWLAKFISTAEISASKAAPGEKTPFYPAVVRSNVKIGGKSHPSLFPLVDPKEARFIQQINVLLSESQIKAIRVPDELRMIQSMVGYDNIFQRIPYFVMAFAFVRRMQYNIIKEMKANTYPWAIDKHARVKLAPKSGLELTDIDLINYLAIRQFHSEDRIKAAHEKRPSDPNYALDYFDYTFTSDDLWSIIKESTQARVAAGNAYLHILNELHLH